MATQIIRPAGVGLETAWVLAVCVLVLALAATFVSVRTTSTLVQAVAEHQIDARRDLTPAEQGLYADLRIAAEEIGEGELLPSVESLAELGITPFVADMSRTRRGEHAWQRLERGSQIGYLGLSREPAVAGALLLVMSNQDADAHAPIHTAHETAEPDVWLHRGESVAPPDRLDTASLAQAGWRQIVAQFDAGVTRQRRSNQISQEAFQ